MKRQAKQVGTKKTEQEYIIKLSKLKGKIKRKMREIQFETDPDEIRDLENELKKLKEEHNNLVRRRQEGLRAPVKEYKKRKPKTQKKQD